jgi:hypothetical protein
MMNQQEFDKSVYDYVRAEGIEPTPRPQSTWYTQATWQPLPQGIQQVWAQDVFAQHNQAFQQAQAQAQVAIQQALAYQPPEEPFLLDRVWDR